jgi:hypothetical protein
MVTFDDIEQPQGFSRRERMRIKQPREWLIDYGRNYPNAWFLAENVWLDKATFEKQWAKYCFIPIAAWLAIIEHHQESARESGAEIDRRGEFSESRSDPASLAALGAWRLTQGIYKFDTELLNALIDTEMSRELPFEVLFRLPQWGVYIDLSNATNLADGDFDTCGFFAFLEDDVKTGRAELRLVISSMSYDSLIAMPPLCLGDWSVHDGVMMAQKEIVKNIEAHYSSPVDDEARERIDATLGKVAKVIEPLVSVLLYLCSDEPDIAHFEGEYPRYATPKKTKRGLRLFAPDREQIWSVGENIGRQIREALEREKSNEWHGRRPHIRRAHWHGFWRGKRDSEERRFGYQWLYPIAVGAGNAE